MIKEGVRVLTPWGLPAVVEAVKPAPYLALPYGQRVAVIKMDTGERHDLLVCQLTLLQGR